MDLQTILAVAIASLIVIVVAHFAVFWVLRTMYPPAPAPAPAAVPMTIPETKTVHVSPVAIQHVDIPTYETPLPNETPREEGATPIGDLQLQDPAAQRDTGLDLSNTR